MSCHGYHPRLGTCGHHKLVVILLIEWARIEMFRDSFHSFQLFREPRLSTLQHVKSTCQMQGLLCAIIAFALKHSNEQSPSAFSQTKGPAYSFGHLSSSGFMALASKYLDQGIDECGDEPLPLVLLQTLILVTHWFLIEGVRGRAWRYLGICVSSAYELNLHLVDSKHSPSNADVSDVRLWCEKEERRRAWWAIWEMDVFASVIRRCPTIINWSQNETWLPVDDEKWFRGEFQQSCLLEVKPGLRWKTLQATGNRSPKAWFIVINALMKDAQVISSPVGVGRPLFDPLSSDSHHGLGAAERDEIRVGLKGLWIVQNSLKSAVMAMPSSARYQHQYLYFGARETDRRVAADQRGLHSSIYGIHLMIQLTKLMIYRYYIFRIGLKWPNLSRTSSAGHRKPDDALLFEKLPDARIPSMAEFQAFEQYFEAADEVIILVRRSHIDQFRYVNPFLANTVWLACAVQLFHRDFATAGNSDYDLVNSSFDLLRLTYDKFSEHWNMSTALQRNLQALEEEFRYVRGGSSASRGGTHDGVSPKLDSLQAHRSNMPAPQGTRESTVSHGESNMRKQAIPLCSVSNLRWLTKGSADSRLNGPTRTANNLEPEESNGPALAGRQSSHFALLSSDVEETVANEPDVPPSRSQTQRPIDWSNSARPETAWPGQLGGASDLGDFPAPFENLFNGMRWDSSLAYLSNESVRTDMSSGFWDFIPFPDTAIPRDGPSAGTNPI